MAVPGRALGAVAAVAVAACLTAACSATSSNAATAATTASSAAAGPVPTASVITASLGSGASGAGVVEQEGTRGAPTFTDPLRPTTPGPKVPPMSYVTVKCRTMTTRSAIATAFMDGWVYLIQSKPWNGRYYAAANTFWNGDIPGHKPYQHNTDFSVPVCKS